MPDGASSDRPATARMTERHIMGRIIDRLLGFSASLRLAIGVILALAAYLAVGTAYESRYGTRAAAENAYGSPLFIGILALLALNVLAAAVIRFPWKRHQTGFVITHLGIEVLLLGCLIGMYRGVDGRVALRVPIDGSPSIDGTSRGDAIDLHDEQLAVLDSNDQPMALFPVNLWRDAGYPSPLRLALHPVWPVPRPDWPAGRERKLGEFQGVTVTAVEWRPAVRVEPDGTIRPIRVAPDRIDTATAALRVRLTARGKSRDLWVIRGEPPISTETPGGTIKLGYGFEALRLPFAIDLIRADRTNLPRQTAAETISARIRVTRPGAVGTGHAIAPNAPATVDGGMTIYLSGVEDIDGHRVAFLSVRRDPGWPIKYLGCALVVFGTAMMFVIRRAPRGVVAPAPQVASARAGGRSRRSPARLAATVLAALLLPVAVVRGAVDVERIRALPVEHQGRVKPLDTVARETVRYITGRERFGQIVETKGQPHVNPVDPLVTLLSWASDPAAGRRYLIRISNLELRKRWGRGDPWASPDALRHWGPANTGVRVIEERLAAAERDGADPELSAVETAVLRIRDQILAFQEVQDGSIFRIVPAPEGWKRARDAGSDVAAPLQQLLNAFHVGDQAAFDAAAERLWANLAPGHTQAGVDASALRSEVRYHRVRPFGWVGVGYSVAVVALIFAAARAAPGRRLWVGLALLGGVLLMHAGAFAWRSTITGWAPVTNMYETVIWVGGVAAMMGLIFSAATRTPAAALAGSVVAVLASVVGDVMPPEMGRAIQNLAPVLQSNLWLTVHVLTVVSSYAAFAVALVLANVALWKLPRGNRLLRLDDAFAESTTSVDGPNADLGHLLQLIYRSVQVGVVLIAAGTVLGGLWADVSWGRFWGWDPKEVWALIVLLSYLALLHGRYAGWVGPFGLAAGSVLCFLTVLMSWYGVNFVLGVGLHSYGFNAGGLGYVLGYVALQSVYVAWAWRRWKAGLAAQDAPRAATEAIDGEQPGARRLTLAEHR